MQENKKHMGCHSKFRHDLPTNKTDAESQFFAKMEMNQHFGKNWQLIFKSSTFDQKHNANPHI
jgi:hypothetical protein